MSWMNIGQAFEKLKVENFINYRGRTIERHPRGGYMYNGKYCRTIADLDDAIDNYRTDGSPKQI